LSPVIASGAKTLPEAPLDVLRNNQMTSDGVFLAVFPTEELLFLGAIVFQFHGLKHCWLRASLDSANLWISMRVKAGYYSFHSLEIQNDHWVLRS